MENKKLEMDFMVENLKISLHNNGNCHHNSKLLFEGLKKLGYNVKIITGFFIRDDGKTIKHSWVEFEDKILETDAEQLHIESNFAWKIIDDKNIKNRYTKFSKLSSQN